MFSFLFCFVFEREANSVLLQSSLNPSISILLPFMLSRSKLFYPLQLLLVRKLLKSNA